MCKYGSGQNELTTLRNRCQPKRQKVKGRIRHWICTQIQCIIMQTYIHTHTHM